MKILQKKFDEFKKTPFPAFPSDDSLDDLYSELVELDGFVAGLVDSYLKGTIADFDFSKIDFRFNNLLDIAQKDSKNRKELYLIELYKKCLDEFISLIKI